MVESNDSIKPLREDLQRELKAELSEEVNRLAQSNADAAGKANAWIADLVKEPETAKLYTSHGAAGREKLVDAVTQHLETAFEDLHGDREISADHYFGRAGTNLVHEAMETGEVLSARAHDPEHATEEMHEAAARASESEVKAALSPAVDQRLANKARDAHITKFTGNSEGTVERALIVQSHKGVTPVGALGSFHSRIKDHPSFAEHIKSHPDKPIILQEFHVGTNQLHNTHKIMPADFDKPLINVLHDNELKLLEVPKNKVLPEGIKSNHLWGVANAGLAAMSLIWAVESFKHSVQVDPRDGKKHFMLGQFAMGSLNTLLGGLFAHQSYEMLAKGGSTILR